MRVIFIFLLAALYTSAAYAQDDLKFGDTGTTTKAPKYKSNRKDYKHRRPIQWVKNNGTNLLIGNPCMEETTQKMGFVYLVQLKGNAPNESEFHRLMHNLFAKLAITFRNGPFWKFKLKKKRRQCRAETGDFVG
jgi:hypothetical protein